MNQNSTASNTKNVNHMEQTFQLTPRPSPSSQQHGPSQASQIILSNQTPITPETNHSNLPPTEAKERSITTPISRTTPSPGPTQASVTSWALVTNQSYSVDPFLDTIHTPKTGHQHSLTGQKPVATPTALSSLAPLECNKPANDTPVGAVVAPQNCLFPETNLPFCSFNGGDSFAVPNHFNHSSIEEVQAHFSQWAWLLRSRCHHSLEWLFCLLLVPKCGPGARLPCRSSCEVLRDSCWTILDEGRLPVECQILPDDQCLSLSNQKGNPWLEWILCV